MGGFWSGMIRGLFGEREIDASGAQPAPMQLMTPSAADPDLAKLDPAQLRAYLQLKQKQYCNSLASSDSNINITGDCGHRFNIVVRSLTDRTDLPCPECQLSSRVDQDFIEEIDRQYVAAMTPHFEAVEMDIPDPAVLKFMRMHGRFPEAGEVKLETEPVKLGRAYNVGLVGERSYQEAIGMCREGETVRLVREPSNPFDKKAIAAICPRGNVIGYIGRDHFLQRVVHEEGRGAVTKILSLNTGQVATGVVLKAYLTHAPLPERNFSKSPA